MQVELHRRNWQDQRRIACLGSAILLEEEWKIRASQASGKANQKDDR